MTGERHPTFASMFGVWRSLDAWAAQHDPLAVCTSFEGALAVGRLYDPALERVNRRPGEIMRGRYPHVAPFWLLGWRPELDADAKARGDLWKKACDHAARATANGYENAPAYARTWFTRELD